MLPDVRGAHWEGRRLCPDDVQAVQARLLLVLSGQSRCEYTTCINCQLLFVRLMNAFAYSQDDFLLRHYDKGPCKNKLGHSRASVVWHRAQVIGIFAGFGILLLVASPLLLLAAPCIICCKCRGCSGSKIDEVDAELEEEVTALQG